MTTSTPWRSLSPAQRQELARRVAAYLGTAATPGEPARNELRAAVVLHADATTREAELAAHLERHLPVHMRPHAVRILPALPRLPNGKIDRAAVAAATLPPLAAADASPPPAKSAGPAESAAPVLSAAQEALQAIWKRVLERDEIGLHDNFFALGGDSLAAMRVLTLARKQSLQLSIAELFAHPTIAELAPGATAPPTAPTPRGEAHGPMPLTPIQHWFLELGLENPAHWNQSVVLELSATVTAAQAQGALTTLFRHHDALRLSLVRRASGWVQAIVPVPSGAFPLVVIPTGTAPDLGDVADRLHRAMRLESGRLLHAAWVEAASGERPKLLLVIHHLAVDAVSWGILREDLSVALAQAGTAGAGGADAGSLMPTGEPLKSWSERLSREAQEETTRAEAAYWGRVCAGPVSIPRDLDGASNRESDGEIWTQTDGFPAAERLRGLAATPGHSLQGLLLAALTRALAGWTDRPTTVVGLEGHGRDGFGGGNDLDRTVGWCTAYFPFRLDGSPGESIAALVRRTSRQWSEVPRRGLGFGLLRYLTHGAAPEAEAIRGVAPEVIFNFLGHASAQVDSGGPLRSVRWTVGTERAAEAVRPAVLEINALFEADALRVSWSYNRTLHRASTLHRLGEAFGAALREACSAPAGATPDDAAFEESGLSEGDLDKLFG